MKIKELPLKPRALHNKEYYSSVVVTLGTDIHISQRIGYTYFEMLGEIGGLQGLVSIFVQFLLYLSSFLALTDIRKEVASKILFTYD